MVIFHRNSGFSHWKWWFQYWFRRKGFRRKAHPLSSMGKKVKSLGIPIRWLILVNTKASMLVGGFKHVPNIFYNIWDVILPIDELHHFSRWLKPPTRYTKTCGPIGLKFWLISLCLPWGFVACFLTRAILADLKASEVLWSWDLQCLPSTRSCYLMKNLGLSYSIWRFP